MSYNNPAVPGNTLPGTAARRAKTLAVLVGLIILVAAVVQVDGVLAGPASVQLNAGTNCSGSGRSAASPGALSLTRADTSNCSQVYLTASWVTNGVNHSSWIGWRDNPPWWKIQLDFPSGTTTVASTHNIKHTSGVTSGFYGTNTW